MKCIHGIGETREALVSAKGKSEGKNMKQNEYEQIMSEIDEYAKLYQAWLIAYNASHPKRYAFMGIHRLPSNDRNVVL